MNISDFTELLQSRQSELSELMRRRMPVIIGRMAKDHFQDNFRLGGFLNGGLHKWAEAKRLSMGGTSAAYRRGTLLSGSDHLFTSINDDPGDYRVRIENNVHYAPVHNWGGDIPITERMRKYAWYRFFKEAGNDKNRASGKKNSAARMINPEAKFWRGMALSKKKSIKIPQRQFLGESQELNNAITSRLESEITKIIDL